MKSKILSLILILTIVTALAIPAMASSNSYNYTMNNRVVNGQKNGEYHTLSSGSASIDGSISIDSYDALPVATPIAIGYTLYRNKFGPNPSFGTKYCDPGDSFSDTYNNLDKQSS